MMTESQGNKHFSNWTCEELQQWIINVKLGTKNQKIAIKEIKQQSHNGTVLNSIQNASDVINVFPDINRMSANKIYAVLKKIKKNTFDNQYENDDQKTVTEMNESWKNKHIDTWTYKELESWIVSLTLSKRQQNIMINAIKEQLITGEDFNSMQNAVDIAESFVDINKIVAKKIYKDLQRIRQYSATLNANNPIYISDDQISELQNKINAQKLQNEQYKKKLHNKYAIIDEMQQQKDEQSELINKLQQQIEQLQTELNEAHNVISTYHNKIEQQNESINVLKSENEQLKIQIKQSDISINPKTDEMENFLKSVNASFIKYVEKLFKHGIISPIKLIDLPDDHFKNVGIPLFHWRKILVAAKKKYQQQSSINNDMNNAMNDWGKEEVALFIRCIDNGAYATYSHAFVSHGVEGKMLLQLSSVKQLSIIVRDLGARYAIMEAVQECQEGNVPSIAMLLKKDKEIKKQKKKSTIDAKIRQRVVNFYHVYNPAKLDDEYAIDELLRRYQGREQQLFMDLETKYVLSGSKTINEQWVVSLEEKTKYETRFYSLSLVMGKASGNQVMNIMLESQLSKEVLRKIWDLSDIDQDGKMDNEEFVLCMYLIDMVKHGIALPLKLPMTLVPPGKRHVISYFSR
eukprot:455816_1